MKKYEKEAFLKTFSIFFLSLMLFSSIVSYFYYKEQKHILDELIFAQMREYTYSFHEKPFGLDVVPYDATVDQLNLVPCTEGKCGYFTIPSSTLSMFKVILPSEQYDEQEKMILYKVFFIYILVLSAIFLFALFYSFYALYPLKKALNLLEGFLKDVIHDLNTPITSILLNTKSLAKTHTSEALDRIELAAQTIASLYRNLESLQQGFLPKKNEIDLETLLHTRAKLYQKLFPKLTFVFNTHAYKLISDEDAVARIFDNLISNACKYNIKNGTVTLTNHDNVVIIGDTGMGISDTKRVFERYYKEHTKGLGLGLNIVQTLCTLLEIHIQLESRPKEGTTFTLTFPLRALL
ncbi:MAG: HAMP domain-containing sensor histidine kinase [Sulfurospirillaceae bacterium]|nr:HAMP domain-containing sensor histidine kinase [Sulfurospirillaceae bacterium]